MRPLLAVLPLLALSFAVAQSDEDPSQPLRECGGTAALGLPAGVQPGLYRGTLAGKTITLELLAKRSGQGTDSAGSAGSGGDPVDRYAYDRHGIDIVLSRGRSAAGGLLLAEFKRDYPKLNATGCFELKGTAGRLSGQWRTPDGARRYPVTLTLLKVAAVPMSLPATPGLLALRTSDPFVFLKLNHPWKVAAGRVTEPLSGTTYPRVPGRAALNAALQDRQLRLAADILDCSASAVASGVSSDPSENLAGGSTSFGRQSGRLLSVHEATSLICGAHPDYYEEGRTYDTATGKLVTLASRPGTLWPRLTPAELQRLYLAKYPKHADSECKDAVAMNDAADQTSFVLYLTPRGLALWPAFLPHVVQACAETVTVPYASLRPLADPKSPYFHDLYPR